MLRSLSACTIALISKIALDSLNDKFLGIRLNGIFGFFVDCLLFVALLLLGYFIINHYKLFRHKGHYWVNDGIVYIQTKKETYSLDNIECVSVSDWSFPGDYRHGQLTIKLKDNKLVFSSLPKYTIETFFDCELAPLLDTILAHNPQLIKDEDLDWWEAKSTAEA